MNSSKKNHTAILGGGLAGLSVAKYLNGDSVVLEAENEPAGLCKTFNKNGFLYDIGGHILFSKNKETLKELIGFLGHNIGQKQRRNEVWYKDRFVKYPFENGLYSLEKEEIFDCLYSFLNRKDSDTKNLFDWCNNRFGKGIAEKYLIPYNEKIWKRDLHDMSLHWVDRIPSPPMEDIIKSAIGIQTEGYTHQLNFYYPEKGGIQSLTRSLAEKTSNLKTNFRVNKIVKMKNEWKIEDGKNSIYSERIVSTIPIFDLINSLEKVPDLVKKAVNKLQYNSIILVMIGVNHKGLEKRTATYIPDKNILPHRVCFMSYFSEYNAPVGCSHLVAEITVPPNDALLSLDEEILTNRVVKDLKDICGFCEKDIIATDVKKIKYAYVVYDSDYLKNTKIIYDYLDSLGIYYTGRFGSFKYINMDKCIEMSKDLVYNKLDIGINKINLPGQFLGVV